MHHDTFGEPYGATGSSQTVFGFTGEPTDANGLVNLRARYYNPTIGQFFSLDPLELGNRYQYVGSNVVNAVDSSGMFSEDPNQWNKCASSTVNNCISVSPLSNNGQMVDANRIDTSLFAQWGVVLTVKCEIPNDPNNPNNVDWKNPNLPQQKQHLVDAFNVVDMRLKEATYGQYGFISVFGGLEIRHAFDAQIGSYGNAVTPQPQHGYLMQWGDRGRTNALYVAAPNPNTQDNIIHELGHVLDYRTGHDVANSTPDSMFTAFNNLNLSTRGGMQRTQRAGSSLPAEYIADHFLNWVRISYDDAVNNQIRTNTDPSGIYNPSEQSTDARRVAVFWLGGDFRTNSQNLKEATIHSPGILTWASTAFLKSYWGILSFRNL